MKLSVRNFFRIYCLVVFVFVFANLGVVAGDFSPFYKQVDAITNAVLKTYFLDRGKCPSIRQCQLDGYIKFSSKYIYIYGVTDVGLAVEIMSSVLQQQRINNLEELSVVIYRDSNQDASRKRVGDLSVLVKVDSFVGK